MANKSKVVSNLPNNGSGRKKKEVVAFNYLENKITIYADVSTASWNEGVVLLFIVDFKLLHWLGHKNKPALTGLFFLVLA